MKQKKQPIDEATRRVMGALLRMPPKQHDDMKVTKGKAARQESLGKKSVLKARSTSGKNYKE